MSKELAPVGRAYSGRLVVGCALPSLARAARKLDLVGMRETLTARKEELIAKLTGAEA